MIRIAYDHVVKHFDFEQLPGADEVTGHFDVCLRRLGLSARVVVHEDNGCGAGDYRGPKYFSGMDQYGVQRSD